MFMEFFHHAIQYFHQHVALGVAFTAAVALLESLPLIGTIIPGTFTMTAMGVLIGAGVLPATLTITLSCLGAFIGDCIGFSVGHHYQQRLHGIWPFKNHPKWLAKGEKFVGKHGGKSIIIGRFFGPVRSTVPMVAGMLRLSWLRFSAAAIPSAILWAIGYLLPGMLVGAMSLDLPPHQTMRFLIIGAIIVIGLWLFLWVIKQFFSQLRRGLYHIVDSAWNSLQQHHTSNRFIRYITHYDQPQDHGQLLLLSQSLFGFVAFLVLFIAVALHTRVTWLNQPLFYFLQSIHHPITTNVMIGISNLADPLLLIGISLLVSLVLLMKKETHHAAHLIGITLISAIIIFICKHIFHSPRPTGFMMVQHSSSFPSGHTTLSTVVYGFIAFLAAQRGRSSWKNLPYFFYVLLILAVGFSRLYLGAHWFTDIIGAYLLGLSLLWLAMLHLRRCQPDATHPSSLSMWLSIAACTLLPWAAYSMVTLHHFQHQYRRQFQPIQLNATQWWKQSTKETPHYRLNRFGNISMPLNIQWNAPLPSIRQTLIKQGWHPITKVTGIKKTLYRIANPDPMFHQPILTWQYQYQPTQLKLVKILSKKKLLELRLWDSHITLSNHTPLWLGTINYRLPNTSLYHLRQTIVRFNGRSLLKQLIPALQTSRYRIVRNPKASRKSAIVKLGWNGRIIMIQTKSLRADKPT